MGRLFWKIFLWFWLAMVFLVLGVSFSVTQSTTEEEFPERLQKRDLMHFVVVREQARVAANLRHNSLEEAQDIARSITSQRPFLLRIIEINSKEILPSQQNPQDSTFLKAFRAHRVTLDDGRRYEIRAEPKPIMKIVYFFSWILGIPALLLARTPELFLAKIGMAIMISGTVCFWLAWYITSPIKRLSEATRQISSGDLAARVKNISEYRQDEITVLSQDFNRMAKKLQTLMSAQQRLLNDVSHELRSPLARLQLAIALIRRNTDEKIEQMLDRIERESEHLDRLVGQLLTLSRLEAGDAYSLDESVDLNKLLYDIVQDANFEAQGCRRRVTLDTLAEPIVRGNRELICRALENVIRNGVKYTPENTEVNVVLEVPVDTNSLATIKVTDAGPGLPQKHLEKNF